MPEPTPTLTKGQRTRDEILRIAQDLTSEIGLDAVTIGSLASKAGMSKSGLYAHFDSKESLQCAILDAAAARFTDVVLRTAFGEPRGLPRINRLFSKWMEWEDEEYPGGCPLIAAATEFDDRPGAVHDRIQEYIELMIDVSTKAADIAVEEGHFSADLDTRQFAYECWGILLAHQHFRRLLDAPDAQTLARRAFEGLLARARTGARIAEPGA
jgi:AcrR family transcriptional regulator